MEDITKMSVVELRSLWLGQLELIEKCHNDIGGLQNNIVILKQEIAKRNEVKPEEPKDA